MPAITTFHVSVKLLRLIKQRKYVDLRRKTFHT
jgi:hypothetical protein